MFQDPVLNHSVSYGKGFLATACSTLHPSSEVVLHDNVIIIAVLSRFLNRSIKSTETLSLKAL